MTKLELPWLAGQQLVHGLKQCLEHARDGSSTLKTRVKLQSSSGLCHIFSSATRLGVLLPSFCSARLEQRGTEGLGFWPSLSSLLRLYEYTNTGVEAGAFCLTKHALLPELVAELHQSSRLDSLPSQFGFIASS